MRVIINIIYLCILLLGGGQYLHAETHKVKDSSNHNLEKKHRIRYINQDSGCSMIEDADSDLDEEFHRGDDLNNSGDNTTLGRNQSFFYSSYLSFSDQFIFKDYSKHFKNFALFCSHSNPIYIRIRVLLI